MSTPMDPQPREAAFFTTIRSWGITRGEHGVLGGVLEGVGKRIGLAAAPARILYVVAALFLTGISVLAYAAAWALLPDAKGNIVIQNFGRGVPNVGALVGIGIFTLIGLTGLGDGLPLHLGRTDWPGSAFDVPLTVIGVLLPLAALGAVIWLIVYLVKRSGQTPAAPGAGAVYAVTPAQAAAHAAAQAQAPVNAPMPAQTPAPAPAQAAMPASAATAAPVPPSPAFASAPVPPMPPMPPVPPAPPVPPVPPVPPFAAAPVPPAPPVAPPPIPLPPPAPRVPGPGRGFYLLWLAWTMLSIAAVAWTGRNYQLEVHPATAWFVVYVIGLGVILVAVSLSGRKLGFLGFLGITLAFPTLVIGATADDLRRAYQDNESLITIDFDTNEIATADSFDPSATLAPLYSEVVLNGTCYDDAQEPVSPASVARLTYGTLTEDTTVDVTAEVTYLSVVKGTNITLTGVGDAQAEIIWADRDMSCNFWNPGGTHMILATSDAPTLELEVRDDAFANTIVISETQP